MPISETQIKIICFVIVLFFVSIWEVMAPRRQLTVSKTGRWFNNLTIILLDSLVVRILFPVAAVGVSVAAQDHHWGLFNVFQLPRWIVLPMAVLLLDLTIYLQHVMVHAVPLLWRVHMVHHADLDYDVTTGLRFHPVEIMLSMGIKMVVVAGLGLPVLSVLIFEIILNATAMFNHGNIHLPEKIDSYLRLFVVTPDMHRVHHSVIIHETNRNFGFNFPWWDRLFGTYLDQPVDGHTGMSIGISQFRTTEQVTLSRLLLLPFIGKTEQDTSHFFGNKS